MFFRFMYLILIGIAIIGLFSRGLGAQTSENSLVSFKRSPAFGLPIDCTLGEDCWVANYVDIGPDDGKQSDPACQKRTYDGHKGTDFAIPDEVAMKRGVNVLASMEGTVKRIRDSEPDRWPTAKELSQIKEERKECGNAVLIDHGNGLQSIYCHLKQGSVKVEAGQDVKRGDVIGQVGLSGFTEFPHLHFGILWEGAIVDPFTGQNNTEKCGVQKRRLWDKDLVLEYQPFVIQNIGFTNILPEFEKIEKDSKSSDNVPLDSELLAFWITMLGAQEGDRIMLEIRDPDGKIFTNQDITQPKTRARQFYFTGRKLTQIKLKEGAYTGTVKVIRKQKDGSTKSWDKIKAVLVTP